MLVLPVALALLIVSGYALALWHLLRREHPWSFTALALLCGASAVLRLVMSDAYPWGLFEDEPKFLACSMTALADGAIAKESCIHIPYLLTALFEAQLVPLLGPTRWAIRTYSLVTSVLATPAAFGLARSMRLRVAPALAVAGLVAVMPWSIFYGRISLGGELILHETLLLAGLARLIWMGGAAADALLAGFGLCLLLWDYWAGRVMTGMPLVAAVLATGWRRVWCLAVIPIALLGWYPHLASGPQDAHVGFSLRQSRGAPVAGSFDPGFATAPLETLKARVITLGHTLTEPVAAEAVFTMRSVAMHPLALLAIAAIGVFTGVRRGLFLLAGFIGGVIPGVVSGTFGISAHRIIMSYVFVALAAGCVPNILPWRGPRALAAAALWVGVAAWSIPLYFSGRFWPPTWQWSENAEITALAEAVAEDPPARLIFMWQLGNWGVITDVHSGADYLTTENWLPQNGQPTTYLFTEQASPLRPEYDRFFPGRVRPVGRKSFLVKFESADWSWVRRYGWAFEARCGDKLSVGQVPFLYNLQVGQPNFGCPGLITYTWRAHWHGPETEMTLAFTGNLVIQAPGLNLAHEGYEQMVRFTMPADTDVVVRLQASEGYGPIALLRELTPAGPRVPSWDEFTPLTAPNMTADVPASSAVADAGSR